MKLPGPGACTGEEGLGKLGPIPSKKGWCLSRNKGRNKEERVCAQSQRSQPSRGPLRGHSKTEGTTRYKQPPPGLCSGLPSPQGPTLPSGLSVGLPEARAPRSGPSTRLSLWWHSGTSLTIASSYEADSSNQQPPPQPHCHLTGVPYCPSVPPSGTQELDHSAANF